MDLYNSDSWNLSSWWNLLLTLPDVNHRLHQIVTLDFKFHKLVQLASFCKNPKRNKRNKVRQITLQFDEFSKDSNLAKFKIFSLKN